jgi:hypothetical protein
MTKNVYGLTQWKEVQPVPNTLSASSRPWYFVMNSRILDLLRACQSLRSISTMATAKEREPTRDVSNAKK